MSSRACASSRCPPVPAALGGVLGLLGGTAAQCLAWLFGVPAVTTVGLVLGAAAAAAVATVTTAGGTAVAALLCWAFDDGFALHRFGELHLAAADRRALAGVALAAAAAHVLATLIRLSPAGAGRPGPVRRVGTGSARFPTPAPAGALTAPPYQARLRPAAPVGAAAYAPSVARLRRPPAGGRGRLCA